MIDKKWMKFGGAAVAVALLVTAGVAVAHGMRGSAGAAAAGLSYDGEVSSGLLTNVNDNGTVRFESISYTPADVKIHARGPGVGVRALNATTVTLVLPADATLVVHEEVEDWSPAGATIAYADGTKLNLVLKNATLAQSGQTLTVSLEADGGAHVGPVGKPMGPGFGPMGEHGDHGRGPGGPGAMGGPGSMGGSGGPRGHR